MSSKLTKPLGRRSRARSSSSTRFFVTWKSQVVNLHRSENVGQALEDADEDLLRQVLGERAVAGQAKDVVVHRRLVHADDRSANARSITLLRFVEGRSGSGCGRDNEFNVALGLRLLGRSHCVSTNLYQSSRADLRARAARARSARCRRARRLSRSSPSAVRISGTRFVVCAVCGRDAVRPRAAARRCRGRR